MEETRGGGEGGEAEAMRADLQVWKDLAHRRGLEAEYARACLSETREVLSNAASFLDEYPGWARCARRRGHDAVVSAASAVARGEGQAKILDRGPETEGLVLAVLAFLSGFDPPAGWEARTADLVRAVRRM